MLIKRLLSRRTRQIKASWRPSRQTIFGVTVALVLVMVFQVFYLNRVSAISLVGANSATSGSSAVSSLSISAPTGLAIGDVMIVSVAAKQSGSPLLATGHVYIDFNDSSTFTTLATHDESDTGSNLELYTAAVKITSTPLSSYVMNLYVLTCSGTCTAGANTAKVVGGIVAYRSVASVSGEIVNSAFQLNASSSTSASPTVTNSNIGDQLITIFGAAIGTTFSLPSNTTEEYTNVGSGQGTSSRSTISAFDVSLGSVGPFSKVTTLGSAAVTFAYAFVLRSTNPTTNQSSYRWYQNLNKGTYQVKTNNVTANADAAYSTTNDGTYQYTVGYEGNNTNDWRIEKRDLADGSLVSAFGTSGAVSEAVSTNDDRAESIVTDGTYLYIAGYDSSAGATDQEWRLEKRNATTGNLCSSVGNCAAGAFNTTGVITSNPSTGADTAYTVLIDANYVYVSGSDFSAGNDEWRVEKYNNVTGAICSNGTNCAAGTFGTAGVVTSNPSANSDVAYTATLDSNYIYLGGNDSTTSTANDKWRIEKYNINTGAICSNGTNCAAGTFGTAGVVTSDPSTSNESITPGNTIRVDANYLYVTGTQNSSSVQDLSWRLEKYNINTGAICSNGTNCAAGTFGTAGAVTINPTTSADDTPTALVIDSSNIYWGGNDRSYDAGFSAWHVEKRDISTGNLVTNFGTSGVYISNPSTNHDEIRSMFLHDDGIYIAGYDYVPGNYEWRYEKISTLNGLYAGPSLTPLAAQNTAPTGIAPSQQFRLRILIGSNSALYNLGLLNLKLQYSLRGTDNSCDTSFTGESYADVTTTSPIAYYVDSAVAYNMPWTNSNDPTDSTNPVSAQLFQDSSNSTNFVNGQSDILASADGEWDISLYNYSASAGSDYCLRVINNSGSNLDAYSYIPEIIIGNLSPAAPTLSAPASGATSVSTTPLFQLKATDTLDNYARYKILVYQSDCSTLVRTIDQTASQTGWSGQDAQTSTAYVLGTTLGASTLASHTYQATALSNSTTYCWKAAAIDPGGSNAFGAYSATQLFTTLAANQPPAAPTLTKPTAAQNNVSVTPEFRLNAVDPDSDYVRFKILLYQSNCSTLVSTIDQTASQNGWLSQDQQAGTAYSSGQTGIHDYQLAALSLNTTYCWKAAAIDPAGTNTFGSYSATGSFTTQLVAPSDQVDIGGNVTIKGNVTIHP